MIFEALRDEIIDSLCVETKDHAIIGRLLNALALDDIETVGDIQSAYGMQERCEASIIYLQAKYQKKLKRAKCALDEAKSDALDNLKAKYPEHDKKLKIAVDVHVLRQQVNYDDIDVIVTTFDRMYWMVSARNEKIKEMSTNIRREMKLDERGE